MTNKVLVFSTYEAYLPPLTIANIGSILKTYSINYKLIDLSIEALNNNELKKASICIISIPLYDSIETSCELIFYIRKYNPEIKFILFGAHAVLNKNYLESTYDVKVVSGNELVELPLLLEENGINMGYLDSSIIDFPDRENLRDPMHYSYPGGLLESKVIGNIETTLGCRFKCTHCTVYTLAKGKVIYKDINKLMYEIDYLVDQGINHITFLDAEFLNNSTHGIEIVEKMHKKYSNISFDVISRVDRIIKYSDEFKKLFDYGCSFVTTAIEFPNDKVLKILRKGYRVKDLEKLQNLITSSNIKVNPTLIVFNPWINVDEINQGETFLSDSGLSEIIDPVQYTTRLMLSKGSPLLFDSNALDDIELKERAFDYEWVHPDKEVDQMYYERVKSSNGNTGFDRCCIRC